MLCCAVHAITVLCLLQATPTVDWVALARILVEKSSSQDEFTRITALKWIKVRGRKGTGMKRVYVLGDGRTECRGPTLPAPYHA